MWLGILFLLGCSVLILSYKINYPKSTDCMFGAIARSKNFRRNAQLSIGLAAPATLQLTRIMNSVDHPLN
jgi:hypothetical protein